MNISELKTALAGTLQIDALNAAWPLVENWASQQIDAAAQDKAAALKTATDATASLQATQTALVAQAEIAVNSGDMDAIKAVLVAAQTPATELKRAALLKQQADLAVAIAALPAP